MTSLNDVLRGFTDATIFPIVNDFCMDRQICLDLFLLNNENICQKIRDEADSLGDGEGNGHGYEDGDGTGFGSGNGDYNGNGWGDSIDGDDGDGEFYKLRT